MPSTILSLLNAEAVERFTRAGLWGTETIYAAARVHAERTPGNPAVRDRYRRLTWGELVAAADALAADLWRRGVKPGQRVVFWLPDRIESIVTLLACSRNGYASCPSPHRNHTVAEVAEMVTRLRAAAVMVQPGFGADARERDLAAAIADLPHVRHLYALAPLDKSNGAARPFAGLLIERDGDEPPPPVRDPNRVAYLAFTSGSTGRPKAVMHSDNTLLATARTLCRDWRLGPGSVIYSMSPFSHNLGIGALMTTIFGGAEIVLHDLPRGDSLIDRIRETGVTYLVGVPTHASDLLGEMRKRGIPKLDGIVGFRLSGAAAPPELKQELIDRGIPVQSGYGMTENNSHQYTRPGDPPEVVIGSCGRAAGCYEIRIFDPDNTDRELPQGSTGLVAGRGASLMLGYFDDQVATESSFNATGWFLTGDIGRLDAKGYLTLTGRAKEVIIRGGHNISPARIEELAAGYAPIEHAAVVPIADERLGERICIAVQPRSRMRASAGELIAHLSDAGLSRYELPEFYVEIADMPLMANGKINKSDIVSWIRSAKVVPAPVERR